MNPGLLKFIRTANREFELLIDEISRIGTRIAESPRTLRRLQKIELRLHQVGHYLEEISEPIDEVAESELEVLKYRENLKVLGTVLETLQFSLLAQKSHLENAQANLNAANAWATALRHTS